MSSRVPERYGSVVQVEGKNAWTIQIANPDGMTPLSRDVFDLVGRRTFWAKDQAEKALYAVYAGDPGDF